MRGKGKKRNGRLWEDRKKKVGEKQEIRETLELTREEFRGGGTFAQTIQLPAV